LRRSAGDVNEHLEIFLHQNRLRLTTPDAIYSDGNHYLPAVASVNHLKAFLPAVNNVLILGCGLGSIVQLMRAKGYSPHFTIVEIDKVVLQWAMEFFEERDIFKIKSVCADAKEFMARNAAKYDLIFVDVFNGRAVPEFVYTPVFLRHCRDGLSGCGRLVFNYIINDPEQWETVKDNFSETFPGYHTLNLDVNRILVT
jgi:spermidine synthase